MAAVTKVAVSLATPNPSDNSRIGPLQPGEDLAAGDACYVKSDGKVWRSVATAANAAGLVDGFTLESITLLSRQPVSLYHDVNLNYAAGLTPGARYYLSATVPGGLDTAAPATSTTPIAFAVDATRIRVNRLNSYDLII